MIRTALIITAALVAVGCKGNVEVGSADQMDHAAAAAANPDKMSGDPSLIGEPSNEEEQTTDPTTSEAPETTVVIPEFTGAQIVSYMREISQLLVSRPLQPAEAAQLEQNGIDAVEPVLRAWGQDPAFAENAKYLVQQELKASGERDGIDFELPGNLVRHVVENELPWKTILTADYCIDASGAEIECDTGAPYAAGVLGTRAYLAGNASRFNLGRANRMMEVFACRIYPMEGELQPYLEKETLIPMFRANSPDEQTVAEAEGGFGNGSGCYTCHGQFGAHAQLFVKYDEAGNYVADADGIQDPDGELGRSVNGLMTSHMVDPTAAASERSQMFGQTVANLGEAAATIADSDPFLPCQARNLLTFVLGLSHAAEIDKEMLAAIGEQARAYHEDPTYADLAVAAFTNPQVILSVTGTSNEGGTQ